MTGANESERLQKPERIEFLRVSRALEFGRHFHPVYRGSFSVNSGCFLDDLYQIALPFAVMPNKER